MERLEILKNERDELIHEILKQHEETFELILKRIRKLEKKAHTTEDKNK